MKQYKIYRNTPLPSEQTIKDSQNFEDVMKNLNTIHNYKKATKPLYKDKRFLGLIVILSIVMLAIWYSEEEEINKKSNSKKDTTEVKK